MTADSCFSVHPCGTTCMRVVLSPGLLPKPYSTKSMASLLSTCGTGLPPLVSRGLRDIAPGWAFLHMLAHLARLGLLRSRLNADSTQLTCWPQEVSGTERLHRKCSPCDPSRRCGPNDSLPRRRTVATLRPPRLALVWPRAQLRSQRLRSQRPTRWVAQHFVRDRITLRSSGRSH